MLNLKILIHKFYTRYKNYLLFASSTFIVQGINAITLPLFTRLLTQADYGILSASNSVQNFSTAAFRLGTHQSVLKQYIEYSEEERNKYFFSVILFSFLWSLILTLLFSLINVFFEIKLFEKVDFYPYLLIPIFTAGFSVSYAAFQSQLRLLNLSKKFIGLSILYVGSSVLLSVILITVFDLGVTGKLLGNFVPFLFIFIYIFYKCKSIPNIKYWFTAIRFGAPLSISSISVSVFMMYTISFLSQKVSLNEMGIYQIGRNLGLLIPEFLFQAITLTYVPFIYKKLRENKVLEITKANTIIIAGFFVVIIVAIVLARFVVLIFTTPEYLPAIPLVQIFFFSFLFKVVAYLPMISLFHENKTKQVSFIEIISSILFLGLIHWLVPLFGILGVALSFLVQDLLKMIIFQIKSSLLLKEVFNIKTINFKYVKN
jgi:O-antigen/teichoic acid export membrane protein